ncbi:MAG: nucleoside 2-deoxyribosyltransferase [Prevotella sp.]|nr:nucleoside 2-deoxyribosyltransferase [Prevotella sp.]
MKKIYFASPWFNAEQAEREDRVKNKLRELGFNVWSPKESCICPPDASNELRKKTFNDNCESIKASDIIFAVTDGKDMGTIWEAGYANGLNALGARKPIVIAYYCETLGDGKFNLMLANSGDIIITDFETLNELPTLIEKGKGLGYAGKIE